MYSGLYHRFSTLCRQYQTDTMQVTIPYFTLKLNGKDYLIYTENKTDPSGNVEVYTSEVVANVDGTATLASVTDEAIWVEIKKVMLDIAKDGE